MFPFAIVVILAISIIVGLDVVGLSGAVFEVAVSWTPNRGIIHILQNKP